eukprot:g1309.t1
MFLKNEFLQAENDDLRTEVSILRQEAQLLRDALHEQGVKMFQTPEQPRQNGNTSEFPPNVEIPDQSTNTMTPLDTMTPGDLWNNDKAHFTPHQKPDSVPLLDLENLEKQNKIDEVANNAALEEAGHY